MLSAVLTNWNNKSWMNSGLFSPFFPLKPLHLYLSPEQEWGLFLWCRTAIKPYSVSCVAAGQMDCSTVHEFIDDEIANNCFSASQCRNIRLHHQLRHNVPLLFFLLSNENRCRLSPNEAGRAHREWDKTSAFVWCSPLLVAVATVISPASSWPPSHLGAPPSLSQGAFQWGGYCAGMVADCVSPLLFAWGGCVGARQSPC